MYMHCEACGNTSARLLLCSGCNFTRYCSVACQRQHWSVHKKACLEVANVTESSPCDARNDAMVRLLTRTVQRMVITVVGGGTSVDKITQNSISRIMSLIENPTLCAQILINSGPMLSKEELQRGLLVAFAASVDLHIGHDGSSNSTAESRAAGRAAEVRALSLFAGTEESALLSQALFLPRRVGVLIRRWSDIAPTALIGGVPAEWSGKPGKIELFVALDQTTTPVAWFLEVVRAKLPNGQHYAYSKLLE
jgi:hypothetical protein